MMCFFRFCTLLESISKVDDFGMSLQLLKMGNKVKSSLQKLRLGFAHKGVILRDSQQKESIRFSETILCSDDDSEKNSMSSLESISDHSSATSKLQAGRHFERKRTRQLTSKFTESVQPFLPQSAAELAAIFLSRFPSCQKEAEFWALLIKKVRKHSLL